MNKPILMAKTATLASKATEKAHAATVKPSITSDDLLSRPRFLVNELLSTLNSNIQYSNNEGVDFAELEANTLAPLQQWFAEHRPTETTPAKKGKG